MATPRTQDVELGHSGRRVRLLGQEDPRNWNSGRKWAFTSILVSMVALIAFSSSIYISAIPAIAEHYGVSRLVATLGNTTFLLGFATGPLLFAPLSEIWGRNAVYRITLLLFTIFQLGCALAPNIASLFIFRFFSGFFGSPTATNSGGSLTDIWPQSERSVPFALWSAASFLGPVFAPVVGGFISEYVSWRWNFWLILLLGSVIYIAMFLLLPETYAPKLLETKHVQGGEQLSNQNLKQLYSTSLIRPWIMLFTEPILFLLSLYMAFVYGILYLDFRAYPIIFADNRGWTPGISGLSFLGIAVGMLAATIGSPLINRVHTHFVQKFGESLPEARLPHLIVLSWLIPIGLFWFGWTSLPPSHWMLPIAAGVPFGIGLVTLFLGITAYLTDCYGHFSASALAANAVVRSLFGATFPLMADSIYGALGVPWATSLFAFIAVAMAPLPWVFYHFGPKLRSLSKYHLQTVEAEKNEASRNALA